jgi:hypothetical protein
MFILRSLGERCSPILDNSEKIYCEAPRLAQETNSAPPRCKTRTLQNTRAKSKLGLICCDLLELKVVMSEPSFAFETV